MSNQKTENIIASAIALPVEERLAVIDAIHVSLADPTIDHGSEESSANVQAAWKEEIARRIDDINNGHITTIPADEAERMIRGDATPSV